VTSSTLELPFAPVPPASLPAAGRRLWLPERAQFTPDALAEPFGRRIRARVEALGVPVEELRGNRLVSPRGLDARESYRRAKRTLAVVNAPQGQLRLSPIPPSADWQFHLAQGCPAHCQYCYLAGSLQGPPVVRAYANVPAILANLAGYVAPDGDTSFEASCYTDPLALEHLTGVLDAAIRWFGARPPADGARLRWTTKFAAPETVAPLLDLPHGGRTRARVSVNAALVARRLEGGTATVEERLAGAAALARAGYPVGLVIAPIVRLDGWQGAYGALLDRAEAVLAPALAAGGVDLTVECITHRFTPSSKQVLDAWYPGSTLEMDASTRAEKRHRFGGVKYVFPPAEMRALRAWFAAGIAERLPRARLLYWT
jgi:spore photoproduct lyase